MNKIKKTILTLVALLAVTTGAWADDTYTIKFEANGNSKTVENVTLPHTFSCDYSGENGELDQIIKQLYGLSGGCCGMNSPGASGNSNVTAGVNGDNQFITISAPFEGNATVTGAYFDAAGGYIDFDYSLTISCPGYDPNAGSSTPETETLLTTITATAKEQASYSTANVATVSFSYTASGSSAYLANWGWWGYGWIATVTAAEGYTITKCIFYDDANRTATDSEAPFVVETTEEDKTPRVNGTPIDGGNMWSKGIKTIEVYGYVTPAASSGPEVAWDKAEKTGSFTMPGGNVTLEPEYYPQAALATAPTAINDVPATTDGAIVSAGTVANIGETTTAQGTVMYYVSPSALDDAALLALAADQWTADVPTAAGLAQGQAYVYYYVRGNDSDTDDEIFSDGDILATNALTVTLGAAPTYAVTFADDLAEPDKWTASPATDVKKGQTVTVTYTGSKKVIGVKAEKKAAAPATALAPALENGATVVIAFNYGGANTCTFTNNNGTFTLTSGTGSIGGNGNSAKQLTIENGNIVFKANYYSPIDNDWDSAGFQVTFDPTANSYAVWKSGIANSNGGAFTSITVNGTDVTSQLSELK